VILSIFQKRKDFRATFHISYLVDMRQYIYYLKFKEYKLNFTAEEEYPVMCLSHKDICTHSIIFVSIKPLLTGFLDIFYLILRLNIFRKLKRIEV
jgi:hypothetical protein